jgi:hypothetical protein
MPTKTRSKTLMQAAQILGSTASHNLCVVSTNREEYTTCSRSAHCRAVTFRLEKIVGKTTLRWERASPSPENAPIPHQIGALQLWRSLREASNLASLVLCPLQAARLRSHFVVAHIAIKGLNTKLRPFHLLTEWPQKADCVNFNISFGHCFHD